VEDRRKTKRRERAEEGEDRKKKKKKKRRRERKTEERERRKKQSRCHHCEPLTPLPVASSSHRMSALLPFFFLLLRPCHTSTVHVACEQWRALFTRVGPSLAHVVGPGLAHFKKTIKREKIYFLIFVISPLFDLCFFLLNIDLYFIL